MNLKYALAVSIYCGLIFFESSHSIPFQADRSIPGIDKVVHAVMYGVLAGLVALGMRRSGRSHSAWALFLVPVLFAWAYGISDEIHQYFVPSRSFDPWDVLANTAGAILMQYFLVARRWRLKF